MQTAALTSNLYKCELAYSAAPLKGYNSKLLQLAHILGRVFMLDYLSVTTGTQNLVPGIKYIDLACYSTEGLVTYICEDMYFCHDLHEKTGIRVSVREKMN